MWALPLLRTFPSFVLPLPSQIASQPVRLEPALSSISVVVAALALHCPLFLVVLSSGTLKTQERRVAVSIPWCTVGHLPGVGRARPETAKRRGQKKKKNDETTITRENKQLTQRSIRACVTSYLFSCLQFSNSATLRIACSFPCSV